MKVLQVISSWQGGDIRVAFDISRELRYKGHEVMIYATNLVNEDKGLGIISGRVLKFNVLFPKIAKKIKFYITPQMILWAKKTNHFDIIHFHGYRTFQNLVVYYYLKKYDVPYVLQAHGSLPRIMAKKRLKWIYDTFFGYGLLRDASRVIALNIVEAEQYKAMGVPEEKITIIPNGIDLSEYAVMPAKGCFKKKFGIPDDKKVILYLGRIHKTKGIDFLVKAYAYLINEMKIKNVTLAIAGPDDGYLREIKELTNTLGISKHVLFTGPLYGRDKLEAYVDSEFCVLPSRYETFPMTVLEAYASGRSVIASEVGGLKDLIMNGETGLLFEPGNIKQLAESMLNLVNDSDLAERMGLKGKELVEENFAIERVVNKLEKVYEEVVER